MTAEQIEKLNAERMAGWTLMLNRAECVPLLVIGVSPIIGNPNRAVGMIKDIDLNLVLTELECLTAQIKQRLGKLQIG
jgi:hypothetical protein